MLEQAFIDYRRFKLNLDITTEEHISNSLVPILTITVGWRDQGESGDLLIRSSEAVIRKMLEIKIALAKEDLAAFHRASRGMNQSMTYNMSNAIKKLVKSHKGVTKITKSFLDLLENVGSFSKDKIPLMLLRRMYLKKYMTSQAYGGSAFANKPIAVGNLSLKKTDPVKHATIKVEIINQESLPRLLPEKEARHGSKERRSIN